MLSTKCTKSKNETDNNKSTYKNEINGNKWTMNICGGKQKNYKQNITKGRIVIFVREIGILHMFFVCSIGFKCVFEG